MFWFIRWLLITIMMVLFVLGLAWMMKQVQQRYFPSSALASASETRFEVKAAIHSAITLLEAKDYPSFFARFIPVMGQDSISKRKGGYKKLLAHFQGKQENRMLAMLRSCAKARYKLSDNHKKATCHGTAADGSKKNLVMIKEKGRWRVERIH